MKNNQMVISIGEFRVCQSDNCHQASSIHHKDSFEDEHYEMVGKKKCVHQSVPFDQSLHFLNFQCLNRVYNVLKKKIEDSLRGLPTDSDLVTQTALCRAPKFKQFFMESDTAIGEYSYLLQIHRGIPMQIYYNFSADFCSAMAIPNDKAINKLYKELCCYSPEWEYLNLEFNYASGINSNYLEAFMNQQVAYFVHYCNNLTQNNKDFSINQYTSLRSSSKDYINDPYYYSPEFVTYLEEKYSNNPGDEELFGLGEYYIHFWKYFFVLIGNNKNVIKYFQEEIQFYKEYQIFMMEQKLNQSFLSFRMWRLNRKTSTVFNSLRNPFFLQTFIYSFIETLIEKKLFYPEKKRNYDFRIWATYLHDFVQFVIVNKEEFNFIRYRDYFQFRSLGEKFEDKLKKNAEIIYDRKFFIEFAHNQFKDGNLLLIRKYSKYQEKRRDEEEEKARVFREIADNLREELRTEYGNKFYEVIWNNFMSQFGEKNSGYELTKQSFVQFRQKLLDSVDQEYIQQKEADYLQSLEGEGDEKSKEKPKKEKKKIEEEINADEEELAYRINEEARSDKSSDDDEEREIRTDCPCCKGRPYECKQPECKVLGACSACMFD